MTNEASYILKCRELIEEKVAWGKSEHWQNQDFDALSDKIYEETNISLSTSTLKRIWGKVKYNSTPNVATLNALAQFVGYENWRVFKTNGFQPQNESVEPATNTSPVISQKKYNSKNALIGLLVLSLVSIFIFWAFSKRAKTLVFQNIHFTSTPVTSGLPNSVVFRYDASKSNADSVFIQQSWDNRRRFEVDKNAHEFVSTYYLPGLFRAKLLLNDSIVKEHDLLIETDGWLGTIDKEPIPVYFSENQIEKNGTLEITLTNLEKQENDFKKEVPWVSLFNVQKSNEVSSKNFTMKTEVKNTFGDGDGICQQTKIVLFGTEGVTMIPLSIKGCVGELSLVIANEEFKGTTKDLSGFGVNFNDWIKVKYEVRNNFAKIFINNQLVYEGNQKMDIGQIFGSRIRFKGTGSVRYFELKENM